MAPVGRALEDAAWASLRGRGAAAREAAPVVVLLDAGDALCLALAALLQEGHAGCDVVDVRDARRVDAALAAHPDIPRSEVCRPGGAAAVLPEGVYLTGLERHCQMLLYELDYRARLGPPSRAFASHFRAAWLRPLRALRATSEGASEAAGPEWWWEAPAALRLLAGSLAKHKLALLDGFLPEAEWRALAADAKAAFAEGRMVRGADLSGLAGGEAEAAGDVRNAAGARRKWTVRGDHSQVY